MRALTCFEEETRKKGRKGEWEDTQREREREKGGGGGGR